MDGYSVLPERLFVGTRLRLDNTRVFSVGGFLPPSGTAGERPEYDIKPPLGAPHLIVPRGYLLMYFLQRYSSAKQLGV